MARENKPTTGRPNMPQRWGNPLESLERMASELSPWRESLWETGDLETALPRVDLVDRESEIMLRAELPGVEKDDLDVSVDPHSVTIRARRFHEERREEGNYYRCEISRGELMRSIPLPSSVDTEKAEASFKNGMLELKLPKREQTRRKRITIQ